VLSRKYQDHFERSGLAVSIAAQKPVNRALLNVQTHRVDRHDGTKTPGQMICLSGSGSDAYRANFQAASSAGR
jgi:hypothetical protein